jgi:hypothetical protein
MNTDDEVNLSEFLTIVSAERSFHKFYRELAGSWLEEVYKPSRRFKKITIEDLAVQSKAAPKKQVTSLRSSANNNEEGDNIFDEIEDEEEDD